MGSQRVGHDWVTFSLFYGPVLTSIHDYWKSHSFDLMDLDWQNDVFVIVFLLRRKCFLISCLQSLSAVILEPKKIKSVIQGTLYLYLMTYFFFNSFGSKEEEFFLYSPGFWPNLYCAWLDYNLTSSPLALWSQWLAVYMHSLFSL